jgi:uncharacterized membrane protein
MNTRGRGSNESMPKRRDESRATGAAQGEILVNAPVDDVYRRWLAFEDYPKFITIMKHVQKLDGNHFAAQLVFHRKPYETMLEIMLRIPERRLAWRTIGDCAAPAHLAAGVVSFYGRPNGTTRVNFKLSSSFGGAVSRRIDKYLHNFKSLIERETSSQTNL